MDLLRKVGKTLVVTAVIMTVVLLAYFLISTVARYLLPSLVESAGMVVAFVLMFALVWYAGDSGQGKSEGYGGVGWMPCFIFFLDSL